MTQNATSIRCVFSRQLGLSPPLKRECLQSVVCTEAFISGRGLSPSPLTPRQPLLAETPDPFAPPQPMGTVLAATLSPEPPPAGLQPRVLCWKSWTVRHNLALA